MIRHRASDTANSKCECLIQKPASQKVLPTGAILYPGKNIKKKKKKKKDTSDHNHHLHWGDEKRTQIRPTCFTSIFKMSFFVNPHETYIFRIVKLLMLAQSFLQNFELESGRGGGRKQKLLCAAKKYHCKILVFIARQCLPSVAESAFFSLHSTSTHRV